MNDIFVCFIAIIETIYHYPVIKSLPTNFGRETKRCHLFLDVWYIIENFSKTTGNYKKWFILVKYDVYNFISLNSIVLFDSMISFTRV